MGADPYRRIAPYYDLALEWATRPLRAIGTRMAPPVPGAAVLDVGCGTGTQLARYPDCRLFGLDASPAMLARARRRLGDGADLRVGDAARMPYPDGSFDLVTVVLVMHELDGPTATGALAEISRVVAPDGRVLVIDYAPGPLESRAGRLRRSLVYLPEALAGRRHFSNFRAFTAGGGVPRLVEGTTLSIEKYRLVGEGNFGLYVLGLETPDP